MLCNFIDSILKRQSTCAIKNEIKSSSYCQVTRILQYLEKKTKSHVRKFFMLNEYDGNKGLVK